MLRSLPKFLLSGSFLALLFSFCTPASGYKLVETKTVTENDLRPIVNKNNSLLYKASIKVYNKSYSGLIVMKQTDPSVSHLVFITEVGMKMFDFEIKNGQFSLVYVFEPLNRPRVVKLLERDMKLILLQNVLDQQAGNYRKKQRVIYKIKEQLRYYYLLKPETNTVERIIVKGPVFRKATVNYFYNDSIDPQQIKLRHKGLVRLKIDLNKLNKQAD